MLSVVNLSAQEITKLLKNRNSILRKQLKYYVKTTLQCEITEKTHLELLILNSIRGHNICICAVCFFICFICATTSCYQIYERFDYYLHYPVVTVVITSNEQTAMLPFRFERLSTEALKPYWKLIKNKYEKYCIDPEFLAFDKDVNVKNFSEFWKLTNVTPHITTMAISNAKSLLAFVHLKNGDIIDSIDLNFFNLSYKNSIWGYSTKFELTKEIDLKTSINILFSHSWYCNIPSITMLIDHLLPYYYGIRLNFGQSVSFLYSQKKFQFLNTINSPCENDENVVRNCFNNCLVKRLQILECRLPYFPKNSKKLDCSKVNDITASEKTHNIAKKIYLATSPFFDCSCQKTCSQTKYYFDFSTKSYNTTFLLFTFFTKDHDLVTITEKFAYDIISLLSDVGGSLGLFLGVSLISVVKLIQINGTKLYKRTTQCKKLNLIISKELSMIMQLRNNLHKFQRVMIYFNKFFFLILVIVSISLIYFQIEWYLKSPTKILVILKENKTLSLPNLILCKEEYEIIKLKINYSNVNNIHACDVHLLDLLNTEFSFIKIEKLWQLSNTNPPITTTRYNRKLLTTMNGLCDEYQFGPQPFVGVGKSSILELNYLFNKKCTDNALKVYTRNPWNNPHFIIKNQVDSKYINRIIQLSFESLELKHYNSSTNPCVTSNHFEKCQLECLEKKIQNNAQCRLPFFSNNNNKQFCNNSALAKESYMTYIKIILQTNIYKECNCVTQCHETVNRVRVTMDGPSFGNFITILQLVPITNLIEIFVELPIQNIVGLLCNFGNVLGITLGLSVLSLMHYSLNCFKFLSVNIKSK